MNITQTAPDTLQVTGLEELSGASAGSVRDQAKGALQPAHLNLEVDLEKTTFVDSSGLGALISLHKAMRARNGQFRLINPSPACRQLLELTRLHRTFEIVTR
jgi:anti-sigma B factor antagonist